jgi:Translation initiation factor IF-2, N-terminal region
MARPRVHEVAKELGLTSKEVLAHLASIGEPVKSHSSTIDEELADRVRTELGNGAAPPPKKAAAKKGTPARAEVKPKTRPETKPKGRRSKAEERPPQPTPEPVPEPAPQPEPPIEPTTPVAEEVAEPAAEAETSEARAPTGPVRVHRGITVKDLAEKIDVAPAEIVKILLGVGEMVTVTQSMSDEAVVIVADELGAAVEVVDPDEAEADEAAALAVAEDN